MGPGARQSSTSHIRRPTMPRSANHPDRFISRMDDGVRVISTPYGTQCSRKDPGRSLPSLNPEPNLREGLLLSAPRTLATSVKPSSAPTFITFTRRHEAGVQQAEGSP